VVLNLPIVWSAPAEEMLERILAYIEYENLDAARRIWALAMEALEAAARFPEAAPQLPGLARNYRAIVSVRPLRILYRVEGRQLRVIAVLRQEQDFDPARFLGT
jgi:plasmid stabilization system protein ParE